jgi:Pyruvate/2-oxoacid:ferredoxin oxidoreductase delta subunit
MKKSEYYLLARSIEKNPFGIPHKDGDISKALIDFLKLIYTPQETGLIRFLDPYPFFKTARQVADEAGRNIDEVKAILEGAHTKYALMGLNEKDQHALPTIFYLFNYHHRYPQIKPGDLEAARLYQKFFIEEGFYKRFETSDAGTPVFRTLPVGRSIKADQTVLTFEEAHARIENLETDDIALVPCPCRTRTEKLEIRECKDKFPIAACIIPGDNGRKFIALGMGKQATKAQALKYLDEMQDLGLVVNSDNAMAPDPIVMCLCCGCCCNQLRGRTRWDNPGAVLESNFIPVANEDCVMCGTCVERCFMEALALDEETARSVVDPQKCIGCGVCTLGCPQDALRLQRLERTKPFDTMLDLGVALYTENSNEK